MLRAAGIVALFVFTACGQSSPRPSPTPSPVVAQGNWTQSLTFAGEVSGLMKGIVPDSGDQTSACTGARTHTGETWSDYFYGTVDAGGQQWGVVFVIENFRGPGTYLDGNVKVEVHSIDFKLVWGVPGDKVTFILDRGQQSGSVEAKLTNATTGKPGLQLTGQWNCKG